MSDSVSPVFAALYKAIHAPDEVDRPHLNEVIDDIEAEGETLPDDADSEPDEDTDTSGAFDVSQLQEFLLDASKGVTTETDKEYKRQVQVSFVDNSWTLLMLAHRLMQRCLTFLRKTAKLIKENDNFFTSAPGDLVPLCICAWIMHE